MSSPAFIVQTPGGMPLSFIEGNQLLMQGEAAKGRNILRPLLARHRGDPWITSVTMVSVQHTTPVTRWAQELAPLESPANPPIIQLILNTFRLIGSWYAANPHHFSRHLAEANTVYAHLLEQGMDNCRCREEAAHLQSSFNNISAYLTLFNALGSAPLPAAPGLPSLYMVGDSHTLAPHHQAVTYAEKPHSLESRLVMGLKLWHLARPENTLQRASLARTLAEVPARAPVLLSAGEIDSRANEGIWAYARKSNRPLENILRITCVQSLNWLAIQNHPRHYIISGIPAPMAIKNQSLFRSLAEHESYARFIARFNEVLREETHKHGWSFLDLHALTTTPEGFSNESWHLEKTHLKPATMAEAFTRHLHPAGR